LLYLPGHILAIQMLLIRLLVALCVIRGALAIYESQLGEYDWLKRNIGITKEAVHTKNGERMYIITEDGVLACLSSVSGAVQWRSVLPQEGAQYQQIAISEEDGIVFTLSHAPCEARRSADTEECYMYEAQGYAMQSGLCSWHTLLHTTTGAKAATAGITDLAYLSGSQRVGVIAANKLVHMNALDGTVSLSYAPPAEKLEKAHVDDLVLNTYLSKVIVNSKGGTDTSIPSKAQHLALACQGPASDHECINTAIISAPFDNLAAAETVRYMLPGRGFYTKQLNAIVSSTMVDKFTPQDAIFAATSDSLGYIALQKGDMGSSSFPKVACEGAGSCTSGSFAIQDKASIGNAAPAAWKCSASHCVAIMAGGVEEHKVVSLDLASCGGTTKAGFKTAEIGFHRHSHSKHVASHVTCLEVPVTKSKSAGISAVAAAWNSASIENSRSAPIHAQSVTLDGSGLSSAKSTQHLSVWMQIGSKKSNMRIGGMLVVDSAGVTTYHRPSYPAVKTAGAEETVLSASALWTRHEALARIEEALLVSRTHAELDIAKVDIGSFIDAALSASEETLDFTKNTLKSIFTIFSKSAPTADEAEQKRVNRENHMMANAKRFGFDKVAMCASRGKHGLIILALDVLNESVLWQHEVKNTPQYAYSETSSDAELPFMKLTQQNAAQITLVLSAVAGKAGSGDYVTRLLDYHALTGDLQKDLAVKKQQIVNMFAFDSSQFLLLDSAGTRTVMPLSGDTHAPEVSENYFYHIDRVTGVMQTYKLNGNNDNAMNLCTGSDKNQQCEARFTMAVTPVATAIFPPDAETIVHVKAPTAGDTINLRTISLSDDSVLLKYLNRNTVLITTQAVSDGGAKHNLYTTLVDTASAKIVYRALIEGGSAPVKATMVENNLSIFYWNIKAKRTEVSSVSLYDGMIDKMGLTPFASKPSAAVAAKHKEAKSFSSFTHVAPLAMQKTFVMPRAVTAVHHTTTAHGIANKNVIVGLESGQVYMLDSRQLSPRRPMEAPTVPEQMDGLQAYQPYINLHPLQAITHNYAMGSGPKRILSIPSRLESSSMVLTFGRPDVHFNRVLPSADFDLLATDFNYPLLTLSLGSMGILVMYLARMTRKRVQKETWK